LGHEKAFKDTHKYYWQAPARLSQPDEHQGRPKDISPQAQKRQSKAFALVMLTKAVIGLLGIYQRYMRMALPLSCRFRPTCSEYTKQGITKYGLFWGSAKGIKRILGCHPFSDKSGYDPLL